MDIIRDAWEVAQLDNAPRMVLKQYNFIVSAYVYRHYKFDDRDVYSAVVYPDGTITYGNLLADRNLPTKLS